MRNTYYSSDRDKTRSTDGYTSPRVLSMDPTPTIALLTAILVFGSISVAAVYAQEEVPVEAEICSDGIDNNNDGSTDEEPCELVAGTNEICSDGIDNNNDGSTDEEPCELVAGTSDDTVPGDSNMTGADSLGGADLAG